MVKAKKSPTNNQWQSINSAQLDSCSNCGNCDCGNKEKTATDNQWTSTNKN